MKPSLTHSQSRLAKQMLHDVTHIVTLLGVVPLLLGVVPLPVTTVSKQL